MNLQATQAHASDINGGSSADGSNAAPNRFAFASGARPLPGYTIKRGIGHGGFGEVYYATSDAGKEVALKLIRRNWDIELRGVTQCLNLKHPNLLLLYDVRQDTQGENWVVMELMSGESLEDLLSRHPDGLPTAEALAWMQGIAAGVAYLHDHGIVHRDLKPGNIFIDEGIVKIGDYGLSKFISCSRRSGQTGSVGTVHYMAPEIANGRYGKEIDIYALGIICYELLTGHVPFEGESVGEILMKHLTAEPNLERLADPYRTIVGRCLAKDPNQRFTSVNELLALLPPVPHGTNASQFARAIPLPVGNVGAAPQPAPVDARAASPQAPAAPQKPIDEPLTRWVRESANDFTAWAERKNLKPWQKLLIVLAGLYVALAAVRAVGVAPSGREGGSVLFVLIGVCAYVIYRNQTSRRGTAQAAPSMPRGPSYSQPVAPPPLERTPQYAAGAGPVAPSPYRESPTRRRWRTRSALVYNPGPPRQQVTQLLGSMLLASVICPVMSLVVLLLRGVPPEPNLYAWISVSAILGTWAVLIPAKVWEGRSGDAALRRFAMLAIGLLFGAAAFGLCGWFMVTLTHEMDRNSGGAFSEISRALSEPDGSPRMTLFLAYFGFLFAIPRWWRQADPLRKTRLGIWYTSVAVFWSWASSLFWDFPQPWGLMLTAVIAIAVQLSSPCLSQAERAQLSSAPE